jgi:hypothetical protein
MCCSYRYFKNPVPNPISFKLKDNSSRSLSNAPFSISRLTIPNVPFTERPSRIASTLAAWSSKMTRSAPVSIDRAIASASPFPNRRPSALTKRSFSAFKIETRLPLIKSSTASTEASGLRRISESTDEGMSIRSNNSKAVSIWPSLVRNMMGELLKTVSPLHLPS